jgi:hypothetical protein
MGVPVDEPGSNHRSLGIELLAAALLDVADLHDSAVRNANVTRESRSAGAVDN